MAALALALFVLYIALAFGARAFLQLRRTGSTGFRGISGRAPRGGRGACSSSRRWGWASLPRRWTSWGRSTPAES